MKTAFFCISLFLGHYVLQGLKAQGNLQYNQAKIVTDQLQTVPANKVWKITAVYGKDEVCRQVVPLFSPVYWSKALVAGFRLNNVEILSFRKFLTQTMYNNSNTCSANSLGNYDFSPLNFESDPNILPIWVPAGATVQTVGPNVFLSVIEFNIIP
jgi:hypothetical protein